MRFKNLLLVVFAVVVLAGAADAQYYMEQIHWSNVDTVITDSVNTYTSDAFVIPKDYQSTRRYAPDYPSTLSLYVQTSETNDSTWIAPELQLSVDGSNWIQHAILDTCVGEDTVAIYDVTSWSEALYGRLKLTSGMAGGDTVVVKANIQKIY